MIKTMASVITVPFMLMQMRRCGEYHVGRTDNRYPAIESKANRLLANYWRAVTMSKNISKPYPKPGMTPLIFLNKKLTEDEKDAFGLWFDKAETADVAITQAMHDGYKFTVQFQSEQGVFNALMFPPKDGSANDGMCISSKAVNWYRGIAMCVYKHVNVCKGDWKALIESSSDEG
jgi:hypothetical protein